MADEHIYKRHSKTLLLYHIVLPIKYRRPLITEAIGSSLKAICLDLSDRYEINFLEIGYESDHVHFLVQSIPSYSVSEITMKLKSLTAKELFRQYPSIKKQLWGGNLWTSGYYANTVGLYSSRDVIQQYVSNQGKEKEYKKIHDGQLSLFD
ncbi:IS200/IS605 family transposase [Bacteroides sp. 224]|uniref:IS200/IS605 family transposase n=1 Tax=Bacteroides sp. 224 TaxID=2302936 RepID=UPI0013CFA04C|nr:IS200/IS605 family transposase [Bacteroides sp. 224]NDV65451.1 IS200/IS605 family transposase [Bacteroides sp. 224]